MEKGSKKNIHVPLPEYIYNDLKEAAKERKIPATTLARKAIQEWLKLQAKRKRAEEIKMYAVAEAGTDYDLDEQLAESSYEDLVDIE